MYKLNSDDYVKTLCSRVDNKLRVLAIATPYFSVEKKKLLMNSFFNAQCNYCPQIWVLHSHRNNNIMRNLHERCLRLTCIKELIYNDKNSFYKELLNKDGSVSIHHRLWLPNCTKLKMDFRQKFLPLFLKFLLVKQSLIII